MAKLKAPFLSLGATGTVGNTLTVSRRNQRAIAGTIPTHPDARSPAQLAQRERYSHARDLWLTLTPGEKAQLFTDARPSRMTGYNLLLSRYLLDELDLEAWWPLNDGGVPTAHDYSLHQTHGSVFGCVAAPDFCDQVNNAFLFDGINDRVVATTPQLNFTSQDFSLTARFQPRLPYQSGVIFTRGLPFNDGYHLLLYSARSLWVVTSTTPNRYRTYTPNFLFDAGTWYTIGFTRQGTNINIYRNGIDITSVHDTHPDPSPSTRTAKLGIGDNLTDAPLSANMCDIKLYSRALTPAQHLVAHQRYCVHPPR